MKKPYTAPRVYINGHTTEETPQMQYHYIDADTIIFKTSLINYLNDNVLEKDETDITRSAILDSINHIPDSLYENVLDINETGQLYFIDILAEHISANLNFCNIEHSKLKLFEFIQSRIRQPSNIADLHLKRPITLE